MAVGDGANDVPMILGAHVGIGIRGKEGNQAVQASDVAISQFRFLLPLLLCHGRRAYRRLGVFVSYFIYKHVALVMSDVIWAHQFRFRGDNAINEYLSTCYPVITSVTIMFILAFDVDVPNKLAVSTPELYREGIERVHFNIRSFLGWMLSAVYHGCLVWIIPNVSVGSSSRSGLAPDCDNPAFTNHCYPPEAEDPDFWLGSVATITLLVIVVNVRLWLYMMNRFWWFTLCGVITPSLALFFVHALLSETALYAMSPEIKGTFARMFSESACLLVLFLTPLVVLLDAAVYTAYQKARPTPLDKARRGAQVRPTLLK
jgi:phospholipid-translocating ATPase